MNKYKYTIISVLLAIAFAITTIISIKQCISYKDINNQNVIALTDSIKHYKTKNNELYISKTLLLGDLNTLKLANDSLFNVLKSMNIKDPTTVVHVGSHIDNGKKDTAWVIQPVYFHDTIQNNFDLKKQFAFNNEFRQLEGNVYVKDSLLGLNIEKDKVYFDYTLAIENNKVYIKSNNPYVQYDKIQGITLPKQQQKKSIFGIVVGPSIGYGYDFNQKKFAPNIGINATVGFRIK